MIKFTIALGALAVASAGTALMPFPANAQSRMSEVIVFGTDPCPRSSDSEVVICARKPEGERYRIPEKIRSGGLPQTRESWANKAKALETVGNTGTFSCSPVGPGGFTGCLTQVINQARRERQQESTDGTAPEQ
jgi:hypothetical protein